jgi:Asp-tRNA(Asn)/Glu-tRNA(Gln) amidotransferase C subunit
MSEPEAAPPLTKETLRVLAQAQGFTLSDADLDGLLPLVQAVRAMMDELAAVPLEDVEPTSLYHLL